MADFEGLINQALAKQDSADPTVRDRVYQSSRNALVKMLEKTGIVSDDAVRMHFDKLENSINLIEARYQPSPAQAVEEVEAKPVAEEPSPPEPSFEELVEQAMERPDEISPAPVQKAAPENQTALESAEQSAASDVAENEPDIIDELEALLPTSYEAKPLFPSVDTKKPALLPQPSAPVQNVAQPGNVEAPYQSRQAVEPDGSTGQNTPMPPVSAPQALEQPAVQQPGNPAPMETQFTQSRATPSLNHEHVRPAEPSFEDDFAIPEKVDAYLGDTRDEAVYPDSYSDEMEAREPVHIYKRKNPLLRRIWPIFLAIAVVLVILWILYALLANMPQESQTGSSGIVLGPVGETQTAEDGSVFITLLEPTDLSALVTAGRGSAELIAQQNQQVLRLQSLRQGALTASGAEPILLELEKGVLNQISGKSITVELYAKSGQNGPAQFAVECDFAGDSICGRKRFSVGTQPGSIVFALDLTGGIKPGERAYLAINTDITNSADASGNGDVIDVIYVRLRLPSE